MAIDTELMRAEASEDAADDVYAEEVVQLCDYADRLRAERREQAAVAARNSVQAFRHREALAACCDAIEYTGPWAEDESDTTVCDHCGGNPHMDDCPFGKARTLLSDTKEAK